MSDVPRKTAADFDPRILEIFDGYLHGAVSKREFIAQAGRYAAAGVTGAMLLDQLAPDYALAQQVAPDDPARWFPPRHPVSGPAADSEALQASPPAGSRPPAW